MKRFVFAQQRLLNVRKQQKRLIEVQVASAHAAYLRAREDLMAKEQQLVRMSETMASGQIGDLIQAYRCVEAMHRETSQAQKEVEQREKQLVKAREQLRRVGVLVESLQTLQSLRQREHLAEQRAEQQREIEFDVMRRWAGQPQEGEEFGDD